MQDWMRNLVQHCQYKKGNRHLRAGGDFSLYRKLLSCKVKKRSAGMRTAAYKVDVASDLRRRENVPRHILF